MSNEWGPWIGWNGGECPVDRDAVVEVQYTEREANKAGKFIWSKSGYNADIIAYRVKKEPVVEVKRETARVELYGSIPKEIVNNAFYHGLLVTRDLECTYTDGKLTKIHWEAE